MKKKASTRLKAFDYKGPYAYFLTICTYKKKNYFKNKDVVKFVLDHLLEVTQANNYKVYSYCFMPDHLHLLLTGESESSLKDFMQLFKQKTEFYFRKRFGDRLWHLSYYDHILRKEESLKDVALYIFNNPVRKGLVNDFREYPHLGSSVFDIDNDI
jgi:putative transposase